MKKCLHIFCTSRFPIHATTRSLFSLLVVLTSIQINGQTCANALVSDSLQVNSIYTKVDLGIRMFHDNRFKPNQNTGPSTIYAAALWIGSRAADGQLKLIAPEFGPAGRPPAGPLDTNGFTDSLTCLNWSRMFHIKNSRITQFVLDLPTLSTNVSLAIQLYPEIMGWPARNNPYFAQVYGFDLPENKILAPFFDQNNDGKYDPLAGEYPVVQLTSGASFLPTEWIWNISNTVGQPFNPASPPNSNRIPAEIQVTTWAFDCVEQAVLDRVVFTSHQVTLYGQEPLDSCYLALWADFDLGCYADDYVGSAPDLDAFFVYNQDATDGEPGADCPFVFDQNPPVQSVTLLNRSLDKFIYYNNPSYGNPIFTTQDPELPVSYYRYLSGSWNLGDPLTIGGSGYSPNGGIPTNYAFPGDPADPNTWTMCSADLPPADRRALGSHYVGKMLPGQQEEIVAAWAYHFTFGQPCHLGSTFSDITSIRTMYDLGFTNPCSAILSTHQPDPGSVTLSPNPARDAVSVRYGELPALEITLFDMSGRVVQHWQNLPSGEMPLPVSQLPAGFYLVQIQAANGQIVKKLSVWR